MLVTLTVDLLHFLNTKTCQNLGPLRQLSFSNRMMQLRMFWSGSYDIIDVRKSMKKKKVVRNIYSKPVNLKGLGSSQVIASFQSNTMQRESAGELQRAARED